MTRKRRLPERSLITFFFLFHNDSRAFLVCRCHSERFAKHSSAVWVETESRTAQDLQQQNDDEDLSIFDILAGNIALCLVKSDLKRDESNDGASTGWTGWVDEESNFRVQRCMDKMELAVMQDPTGTSDTELLERRDESQRWMRWMKACPSPMLFELSNELRQAVTSTLSDESLQLIDCSRQDFLERISCRVLLLPSGMEFSQPLRTPPGAMAYGKLLYGGVRRYRLLGATKRRAGERSMVYEPGLSSWLQYGGPERNYQAMDVGPCSLLEVAVSPRGMSLPLITEEDNDEMALAGVGVQWDPRLMFRSHHVEVKDEAEEKDVSMSGLTSGVDAYDPVDPLDHWETTFASSVGGLQPQIEAIIRRVMDGRVIRPLSEVDRDALSLHRERVLEAQTLTEMGLKPVRGLLLYGPPGCGKTQLAREISRLLDARPPKIVAAPELLDRWVGGSEKLVRELFEDAEAELRRCNGDASKSALHVVVIDEIDAVFRKRSSAQDSGEATRASAVNQILSKLDGVNALDNVLLIGMTNRKELLDEALLRPGRLEVQVEIPLPDREGRREILQIHFEALRRKGRLSKPLCLAIDGINGDDTSVRFLQRRLLPAGRSKIRDLATDRWTGGFSGADLAGLVRCAGSIALARARADGGGIDSLLITLEDVFKALKELRP